MIQFKYIGIVLIAVTALFFDNTFTEAQPTVAESAQMAVEAAMKAETAVKIAVPSGAVMAFNLQECPQGWKTFMPAKGRVVLGAGSGNRDQNDKLLSDRSLGSVGGEEKHALTIQEMPSHNHGGATGSVNSKMTWPPEGGAAGKFSGDVPFSNAPHNHSINPEGGSEEHNNMQPYVVLTYCERL